MQQDYYIKRIHELIEFVMSNALTYQTFTGAFVFKNNELVCKEMISVEKDNDPIAHAELKAIQNAVKKYGMNLEGFQLYSTQKPCVMCASAIVWAGIKEVFTA
ncbi:MAG: nucleoside deaminase [Firmicutes bacterium]|nr:nucleoside deaminase [Bacillota bacterium]